MQHTLRHTCSVAFVLLFGLGCTPPRSEPRAPIPSVHTPEAPVLNLAQLQAILEDARAGIDARGVGVVVVTPQATYITVTGTTGRVKTQLLDAHTQFPLGSVSKVFAGLLLAQADERGEIASLDAPVAPSLPQGWTLPRGKDREISWEMLATHTSGLPFFPSNWTFGTQEHRAGYETESFREYLANLTLTREPGSKVEYGNTSTGLLAIALSSRLRSTYPALLQKRIFVPSGMVESDYPFEDRLPPENYMEGFGTRGEAVPWRSDPSPMGPCCVVRATLGDMGRFMNALMNPEHVLHSAFKRAIVPRAPTMWNSGESFGLGFRVRRDGVVWKDGQVHGVRVAMLLVPEKRWGLTVVMNTYSLPLEELAFRLMGSLRGEDPQITPLAHRVDRVPADASPVDKVIAPGITLRAALAPAEAERGRPVSIRAYLQCDADQTSLDYRIYADFWGGSAGPLVLRTGELAASTPTVRTNEAHDGSPVGRTCDKGDLIEKELLLTLPQHFPPKQFDVWMGLARPGGPDAVNDSKVRVKAATVRVKDTP